MPGDMDSVIFCLSICENIVIESIASIYLAHATT
jgi:hypothetical protein